MSNQKIPKKLKRDGTVNPNYVDVLDVDKPIASQAYACFSFITPTKILKQKEMFYFQEFVSKWEMTKSMEIFTQFLNFMSFKYKLAFEGVMVDFEAFVKDEKAKIVESSILDDYKTFLDNNETRLEQEFNKQNKFQTSVAAVKNRGNFDTQAEAELRAKLLRKVDPNFDIYVGPVGQWLCWEPEAYKTGRIEYMEEELNQLVHEKIKNESSAKAAFEHRVKENKEQAMKDNLANAERSGNRLTQTLDAQGNLVDIATETTPETENVTVEDVRNNIFEGDNIVTGKTDNGRGELISGPFATTNKKDPN